MKYVKAVTVFIWDILKKNYFKKFPRYNFSFTIKQGRMKRLKAATMFIWDIWKKKIEKKIFWKKILK